MKKNAPGMIRAALVVMAVSLISGPSRADTVIAGDLDYAVPIDSKAHSGGGFGIRLGQQLHVPLIVLTPEVAFTYHGFSGDFGPTVYRGTGGVRLGIGEVLRPGIFGHLGIGRMVLDVPGSGGAHTAFTYDAGVFLDFTLLPVLNIGAHAAYNHQNGDTAAFKWATLGAHVAFVF